MRYSSQILAATVLVAVGMAVTGCGEKGSEKGELTPQEVLTLAADRMDSVESFAFLMEHENGFTPIMSGLAMERAEGRVSGRDRMQATIRARAGGALAVEVGIVALPDASWMTNPFTRAWEPGTFSISGLFDPATGMTALLRGLSEPGIVAVETVNGARAYRIEATADSGILTPLIPGSAAGSPLVVRVWIGVEDPVMHRAEIVGAIGEGESGELLRRITLSQFGADLPVESPLLSAPTP